MTPNRPPESGPDPRAVGAAVESIRAARSPGGERPVPVLIVAGIGGGKTTLARAVAERFAAAGVSVGGILAPRRMDGAATVGYDIVDIATGERRPFADLGPGGDRAGRYRLDPEGIAFARHALDRASGHAQIVIVDEIGRLELAGGGHAAVVHRLLSSTSLPLLLVRDTLVDEVVERFSIGRHQVVSLRPPTAGEAG